MFFQLFLSTYLLFLSRQPPRQHQTLSDTTSPPNPGTWKTAADKDIIDELSNRVKNELSVDVTLSTTGSSLFEEDVEGDQEPATTSSARLKNQLDALVNQNEELRSLQREADELKATLVNNDERLLSLKRSFEEQKAAHDERLLSLKRSAEERNANYDEMLLSLQRSFEEQKATYDESQLSFKRYVEERNANHDERLLSLKKSAEERKAALINNDKILSALMAYALKEQDKAYVKTIVVAIPDVLTVETDKKKSARAEKRSQRSGRRGLKRSIMEPADTNDMPDADDLINLLQGGSEAQFIREYDSLPLKCLKVESLLKRVVGLSEQQRTILICDLGGYKSTLAAVIYILTEVDKRRASYPATPEDEEALKAWEKIYFRCLTVPT
jgi:hypothetical protein